MAQHASRRLENRFLAGTLIVVALLSFLVLREYLYYVIGGALLVFAFFPIHRRIQRVVRSPAVAAFLSFLLVALVVLGPVVFLGYSLFVDADSFARTYDPNHLNETVQSFLAPAAGTDNGTAERPSALATWLGDKLQTFAQRIVAALVEALPRLLVGLVISGFVIYYGFIDGERFYRRLRLAIPLPDPVEDSLFLEIRRVTKVVFVGNILVSVAGGLFGAVTFLAFGVPNAMFWGFLMIILGILPFVGAPLVWGPAAIWLYFSGHHVEGIALAALNFVFIVFYLDHILRPKLIGRAAGVHPVVVLIGVLGGVETFGVLGFVIGPLVLALLIAVVRNYTEWHPYWKSRRESGLEPFHAEDEPSPRPRKKRSKRA
jgi:predicted PurR-regulated permease PerM